MPTAPSRERHPAPQTASFERQHIERPPVPIPDNPPYTAYLGNLSFDTTERDLETLFRDLNITNIRLIRHDDKPKGFGYIEFGDRISLEDALKYNSESVRGRQIRIDVAERMLLFNSEKQNNRREGSDRGPRRDREADAKFESDWRIGAEGPLPVKERPLEFERGDRRHRDYEPRSRTSNFDRKPSRDNNDWFRRDPVPSDKPRAAERRKLELLPRTAAASSSAEVSPITPTNKPNPFGEARPRDDVDFQRKFEERQEQKRLEQKKLEEEREAAKRQAERAPREVMKKKEAPVSRADQTDSWRRGEALPPAPKKDPAPKKAWGDRKPKNDRPPRESKDKKEEQAKKPVASNPFGLLDEE